MLRVPVETTATLVSSVSTTVALTQARLPMVLGLSVDVLLFNKVSSFFASLFFYSIASDPECRPYRHHYYGLLFGSFR